MHVQHVMDTCVGFYRAQNVCDAGSFCRTRTVVQGFTKHKNVCDAGFTEHKNVCDCSVFYREFRHFTVAMPVDFTVTDTEVKVKGGLASSELQHASFTVSTIDY